MNFPNGKLIITENTFKYYSIDDKNIIIKFIKEGNIEKIKQLIKNGIDVSIYDNVMLCYASLFDHLEIVKLLIKNGADVCAQNNQPICNASKNNNLDMVKFLIENGADICAQNNQPICNASKNNNLDMIRFLIENGADTHAQKNQPICNASKNNNLDMIKILIENGADVRAQYNRCIYNALENNDLNTIKFLVKHGVDINMYHYCILKSAISKCNLGIVKYIIDQHDNDNDLIYLIKQIYDNNDWIDIDHNENIVDKINVLIWCIKIDVYSNYFENNFNEECEVYEFIFNYDYGCRFISFVCNHRNIEHKYISLETILRKNINDDLPTLIPID